MLLKRKHLIVGAGPAGIAAALQFNINGIKPVLADVGVVKKSETSFKNDLYEMRKEEDLFELFVGSDYFGLSSAWNKNELPYKLTSPNMRYVTNKDSFEDDRLRVKGFLPLVSYAKGGLANAWSCGLYEYDDEDLNEFPFQRKDLNEYYERLSKIAGIVGREDDLRPFFGSPRSGGGEIPPLSKKCKALLSAYEMNKMELNSKYSFHLGRSRVATNGKTVFEPANLELLDDQEYLYSPRTTLDGMVKDGDVEYLSGLHFKSFHQKGNNVNAVFKETKTGNTVNIETEVLMIACGCINTTRMVLKSTEKFEKDIELHDNPGINVPIFMTRFIGNSLDRKSFGFVQLNSVWKGRYKTQGTFLELSSLRRADIIKSMPFSLKQNIWAVKHLIPSMLAMRMFYPSDASDKAKIRLSPDGELTIRGRVFDNYTEEIPSLKKIIKKLGGFTMSFLIKPLVYGGSAHCSCTLPMKENPSELECNKYGSLTGFRNVYILDSSNFPVLPSKNNSLTAMANSMRITDRISCKS